MKWRVLGFVLCLASLSEQAVINSNGLMQGRNCLPGSQWKSRCNDCTCSAEGEYSCATQPCPGQEKEKESKCGPGSEWKDDCNTCWCVDGEPLCTRLGCSGIIVTDFNPDRTEKEEEKKLFFRYLNVSDIFQDEVDDHNAVKRNPAEIICKPSESFKIECNSCDCAGDGLSYSCTDTECMEDVINTDVEVFMEPQEDIDHVEHTVCRARTTFYITCNLCRCSSDGADYTCTNKLCPLPKDVELFHELKPSRFGPVDTNDTKPIVCPANKMFVKDCNTCLCDKDGTSYVCTRKVCLDNDAELEKKQESALKCKPKETFMLDCNTCRCNDDGTAYACTRRACLNEQKTTAEHARKVRAAQQETPKNCQPGQEFRMDCNKCLCDNEGQNYSCTRIDCTAVTKKKKREISSHMKAECVPGSEFKQRCNTCRCTADGAHATCTAKRCKDDGVAETDSAATFRCNPGEQFKRGCNDCMCSADGKDVFCTLRLCEQDINI